MPACKCRYCQTKIDTKDAYLVMNGKQKAYFCNEEHYHLLVSEKEEEKRRKAEALEAARQKKKKEHDAAVKQYKADKDTYNVSNLTKERNDVHKNEKCFYNCELESRTDVE